MNEQGRKLGHSIKSSDLFMFLFYLDCLFVINFKKITGNEPTGNVAFTFHTEQPITFLRTSPADSQSIRNLVNFEIS
jgi:hypothetical protein